MSQNSQKPLERLSEPLTASAEFEPETMWLEFDPDTDPNKPFVTISKHQYSDSTGFLRPIIIESGFATDLTSFPYWFKYLFLTLWPFFYIYKYGFSLTADPLTWLALLAAISLVLMDPFGRHQRASLFHDYGYSVEHIDRRLVDAMYFSIMKKDKVALWRCWVHYIGVRLFGWLHKR